MAPNTLRDRWVAWRNRLLGDPRFQRWAAGFPLTRAIADREASKLFDVVAGFAYSQILAACIELGFLDRLSKQPAAASELAKVAQISSDSVDRLLKGAASLGLVERLDDDRFALGPQGAALLGNAGLKEMIAHHAILYADLADPVGLLRRGRGRLAEFWPYAISESAATTPADSARHYSRLMSATQPSVAAEILRAYDVARHQAILDVGGGEGAFLAAAGKQAPGARLILFDVPAVADRARALFEAENLSTRASVVAGDFLVDPLPVGADLVTLVRIVHDHSDAGALRVFTSIREALPPAGALLIAEPMSGAAAGAKVADAYFGMYLLAMGRGRTRSPGEIMRLLQSAGFSSSKLLRTRTQSLLRIIVARP